ncbi:conserved hypothetical protein [Histoplasma capsulatum H143]|uniref:Knr4/Smi1-like domain-containing protein n=1 Tax=Ajellomyces capsulatus (strain H143) TaxID=544712 RepID=C6HHA9_AJECH|nr:conserved hypothetical protein [Histoplasma capsulatum H143]
MPYADPMEAGPSNSDSNSTLSPNKETIKADIEALRSAFASRCVDPPLGWPAVHAFESRYGIILPEPYRTFMAEVASGCRDGPPEYGLNTLSNCCNRDDPDMARLALPFPLTKKWLWEDSPELPEGFPSSAIGQDGEADIFGCGCLDLGTEGCGMDWYLIVTGQQRGQIWLLTGEGAVPFGELFESMKVQPGFAGWALHWAAGKDLMGSDEEYSM